jgi:tetratricopeptide (TPR) repeat protein
LKKPQWIVLGSALILLTSLLFFGRTSPNSKGITPPSAAKEAERHNLDISDILAEAGKKLTPTQSARLTSLQDAITRGDLQSQKVRVYGEMASFWKDSVGEYIPYLWYMGEKAKLENSEKSVNFAAHSYLEELRGVGDPELKGWMAIQAKELFTRSLELNPLNDSAKVGLGSTFFFGAGGNASPMEGIMGIREVAERDSTNMYAQFMLGYGGFVSGQFDKAAERFLKVLRREPDNKEAIFLLAETYERLGDKPNAIRWFTEGRRKVDNPEAIKAINEKIKSLQ